jgi:hypothetical protein
LTEVNLVGVFKQWPVSNLELGKEIENQLLFALDESIEVGTFNIDKPRREKEKKFALLTFL